MTDQVRDRVRTVEYFALPETTQPTQLINGEIIDMPSPTPGHQDVVLQIAYFLKPLAKGRGWRVFVAPLDVEFDELNAPQPDVIVVLPGSLCRVTDTRLIGAPDLIAEVLSPGTEKNDRSKRRITVSYRRNPGYQPCTSPSPCRTGRMKNSATCPPPCRLSKTGWPLSSAFPV